ncbi:LysR family transcriptional regulator [Acanthopleuribacter pedis]|uniref:LysR family transcriptional regulator n=1 Tax=Acanthopleuribacter pedis TaxID=442870 RepID=A0A8J7Q1I4_9BACT|nr:LysR family transcriptional regulator [Acanthopleuribacter pedis]MBO1318712.1 LysR family transcriptional regulator [Acanthopleuribacter pedis]
MEMHQVKYFLAVCEHRNFTQAAHAAHVSQPALTAAIKKLEEELGGPVFLRDRSGCALTPLGELVRPRLQHIQDEAAATLADAVRHIRLDRIPIRIGLFETVGGNLLARSIAQYQTANPTIEIELIYRRAEVALEELRDGLLDVVIAPDQAFSSEIYSADTLLREPYQVVFAKGHRFEAMDEVPLKEMTKETYLDRPNCEMREELLSRCKESGIEIYASYRSNRESWLLLLAAEGVGVAILPKSCVPDPMSGIATRPLTAPRVSRTLVALRYLKQPARAELQALVQALTRRE